MRYLNVYDEVNEKSAIFIHTKIKKKKHDRQGLFHSMEDVQGGCMAVVTGTCLLKTHIQFTYFHIK